MAKSKNTMALKKKIQRKKIIIKRVINPKKKKIVRILIEVKVKGKVKV